VTIAQRRVCGLCGRPFAIVLPPNEPERERDKLCQDCARLPPPPEKYFAGKGTGQPCDLCQQAITADHLEYELDVDGRTVRFDEKCLDMWRQVSG